METITCKATLTKCDECRAQLPAYLRYNHELEVLVVKWI